jgi:nicotinate-nucleotide pyrophosphorylase
MSTLLAVERTASDTLQRLSGIATHTANLVARLAGRNGELGDTRKTTPDGGISRNTRCVAVAVPITASIWLMRP